MTVLEFFRSLDKKEFLEFYLEYDEHTGHNDTDGRLESCFDTLCNMDESKLIENKYNAIVFGSPVLGSKQIDSFLIYAKDLKKKSNHINMRYAYELCPACEILNFEVSNACIYYFGELEYASSILYELTYFGYTTEDSEEEKCNIVEDLNETVDAINNDSTCLSKLKNSVFKDYIDDRKPEEKEFDHNVNMFCGKLVSKIDEELIKLEKYYRGLK